MAKELFVSHTSGTNVYAVLRVATNWNMASGGNVGKWYSRTGGAVEAFTAGHWANYAIALDELGTTGFFEGDMPAGTMPERVLEVYYFERAGGTPAMTDTKVAGALFEFKDEWVATSSLAV